MPNLSFMFYRLLNIMHKWMEQLDRYKNCAVEKQAMILFLATTEFIA